MYESKFGDRVTCMQQNTRAMTIDCYNFEKTVRTLIITIF